MQRSSIDAGAGGETDERSVDQSPSEAFDLRTRTHGGVGALALLAGLAGMVVLPVEQFTDAVLLFGIGAGITSSTVWYRLARDEFGL